MTPVEAEHAPPHVRAAERFRTWLGSRKLLAAVCIGSSLALGLVSYSLSDPVYEIRTGLTLGKMYKNGQVESIEDHPYALAARMMEVFRRSAPENGSLHMYPPFVNYHPMGENIYFVARGDDAEALKEFVQAPLEAVTARHDSMAAQAQAQLESEIRRLEQRLLDLEQSGQSDAEKRDKLVSRIKLMGKWRDPPGTHINIRIKVPETPVGPRLLVHVYLALLAGLLLCVAVAYFFIPGNNGSIRT